ncbi:ATP-NAD kinase-like domain-containing protein [Cubamyces lactineus]|nr:ATP-NAD kinase-like domain-containing protein [Cubamyces lactineus]
MSTIPRHLSLGSGANLSKFSLDHNELLVERVADKKWPKVQVPLRNVLWAGLDGALFELSVLAKKKAKAPLSLVHVTGTVRDADKNAAAAFADALMAAAYPALQRQRRLKVFINPKSGPGKAAALWRKKIEPIFRAAKCDLDLTFTSRRQEAQDIAAELPLDRYDAVVVMSGDGLIHEVFNGYAAHAQPAKAFSIPVAPIPSGSGNALAINLLGPDDAQDLAVAALNVIKGRPMSIDLFSFTQGGRRHISFMSQSIGLIADVDLGTDPLRFLGGQRFILGFIYEVIRCKTHPLKVSIKVADSDKRKMVRDMQAARAQAQAAHTALDAPDASPPAEPPKAPPPQPEQGGQASEATNGEQHQPKPAGLPELKYANADMDEDGWVTFDRPLMYLFAGKGPFVGPDVVQFPVSLPTDGLIDVTLQDRAGRLAMLKAIDGAERGEHFWLESQHYYKAHAYRVEPYTTKGWLSIDGEPYPLEPFQVEVHQRLGTLLSMYGCYQLEFDLPPEKR